MGITYNEAVEALTNWYNTSSANVWNVINDYNLTPEQAYDLIPSPDNMWSTGYGTVNYADGTIASWNNTAQLPITTGGNPLDSNAGTLTQNQFQYPANTDYSGTGGSFNGRPGVTGGVSGVVHVMTQIGAGIACTGLGISLGKKVNQLAYDRGFNWLSWAGVNIESLDPQKWDSITVDMSNTGFEGALKRAFNAIFGITPNGSQMYLDAEAIGYLAKYMDEIGLFAGGVITGTYDNSQHPGHEISTVIPQPLQIMPGNVHIIAVTSNPALYKEWYYDNCDYIVGIKTGNRNRFIGFSSNSSLVGYERSSASDPFTPYTVTQSHLTANDTPFYTNSVAQPSSQYTWEYLTPVITNDFSTYRNYEEIGIGTILYDGDISQPSSIEGIDNQDGAVLPVFTGAETPDDYLHQLEQQYPDMFDDAIEQDVAQPDGTITPHRYIPVGTPTATGTSDNTPTTDDSIAGQAQDNTVVDPATSPANLLSGLVNILSNLFTPTTNPPVTTPDTGTGDTPATVPPAGTANALYSIYNPSQSELNSFGAWLWSSSFVDQLLKLFNDPMQAIIGLHKVYAQPIISGVGTIKVGYLDSNVSSNLVGAQYVTIDCGSVSVGEYFGNVFDYSPYTNIYIYLPFIGIQHLNTGDVMRGTINVTYHVDVITGACLAEISVYRDGFGGVIYTFTGNCAVQYPISAGSYMGIVSSIASVAGGIIGTIATGGAMLPAVMGGLGGVMGAHTSVQHSGSFSGNPGAMGNKTPYLIITRAQSCLATAFPSFEGYPANYYTTVGGCSGLIKCVDCHVEFIPGTETEIAEIETLLKTGIIV